MRTQGVLRYRPHRLVTSQNSQSIIKDCQEFGSGAPSRGDLAGTQATEAAALAGKQICPGARHYLI